MWEKGRTQKWINTGIYSINKRYNSFYEVLMPNQTDKEFTFCNLSYSCWLNFVISDCSPRAAWSLHTWGIIIIIIYKELMMKLTYYFVLQFVWEAAEHNYFLTWNLQENDTNKWYMIRWQDILPPRQDPSWASFSLSPVDNQKRYCNCYI